MARMRRVFISSQENLVSSDTGHFFRRTASLPSNAPRKLLTRITRQDLFKGYGMLPTVPEIVFVVDPMPLSPEKKSGRPRAV